MKVDTGVEFRPNGIGDAARAAEALGYDGAWTTETNHDPFLPLVLAAEATERIELGTAIAVAFARNPMNLATLSYDLQNLSAGRFVLGLGSQVKAHITRRYSMPWSHPAPRMREMILAIRAIWESWQQGTKLDFQGEFYSHTLMTPFFAQGPCQYGPPPIYVAAVGSHMCKVAGEVADGVIAHSFSTERFMREVTIPMLLSGAQRAGKERKDLTVAYSGFVVFEDTPFTEEVKRAARGQIAFYGSTPAYRPVLELHGWGDLATELNKLSKEGRWDAMGELIDDDVLDAFAVVGPLEEMATRIHARFGDLVDRFSFYTLAERKPWEGIGEERWQSLIDELHSF